MFVINYTPCFGLHSAARMGVVCFRDCGWLPRLRSAPRHVQSCNVLEYTTGLVIHEVGECVATTNGQGQEEQTHVKEVIGPFPILSEMGRRPTTRNERQEKEKVQLQHSNLREYTIPSAFAPPLRHEHVYKRSDFLVESLQDHQKQDQYE